MIKFTRALMLASLLPQVASAQLQVDEAGDLSASFVAQVGDRTESAEVELVRERYSDGKIHVEKQVAMAKSGDFVNHGSYREYSPKGDVLVEGRYEWGVMVGTWVKRLDAAESKKVEQQLNVAFKAPFISSAEFVGGKLNNVWTIVDKDNKVIVQIELKDGLRDGLTTIYAVDGEIRMQQTFSKGVLNGASFEKLEGKNARDEKFVDGRKVIEDTQRLPNGNLKSSHTYLSPAYRIATPDNWLDCTFGKVTTEGEKTLHGAYSTYHETGKLASKGNYHHGQLQGEFESWHRNGEVAVTGRYENGVQTGTWVWRHANGMKESVANYVDGKPEGRILAWDQNGKAISQSTTMRSVLKDVKSTVK